MDVRRQLGMDKSRRLRKDTDFRLVRHDGRSWAHPLLVLYARPTDVAVSRVGISVSKRIGNAVARNRAKRLIREAARLNLPATPAGWDMLFIARPPISQADFTEVRAAVEQLLRRANLVVGTGA